MKTFSDRLVHSCFPDRESILLNIDYAIFRANRDGEQNVVDALKCCLVALESENVQLAADYAEEAGYPLMRQAITSLAGDSTKKNF